MILLAVFLLGNAGLRLHDLGPVRLCRDPAWRRPYQDALAGGHLDARRPQRDYLLVGPARPLGWPKRHVCRSCHAAPRRLSALSRGGDHFALATVFTSMFLHGGLIHIIGNMIFLVVFGAGVEEAFGPVRFALYYIAWGIAAAAAQIWIDPNTSVQILGASGAIGGVLGAYFLMFPTSKIEYWSRFCCFSPSRSARGCCWGFGSCIRSCFLSKASPTGPIPETLAGMLTVLVLGGRSGILKSRELETTTSFRPL